MMSLLEIAKTHFGDIWTVGASVFAVWQWYRRKQSDVLTHRFLVGLKASASPAQIRQIDDELERIKPSKRV
jgi:exoribonuclease II